LTATAIDSAVLWPPHSEPAGGATSLERDTAVGRLRLIGPVVVLVPPGDPESYVPRPPFLGDGPITIVPWSAPSPGARMDSETRDRLVERLVGLRREHGVAWLLTQDEGAVLPARLARLHTASIGPRPVARGTRARADIYAWSLLDVANQILAAETFQTRPRDLKLPLIAAG